MSKTAYLIVGPESCGNRLWGRLLVAAGCYGDGDCVQRLDSELTSQANLPERVMLIRSFPHSGYWPDIDKIWGLLRLNGYEQLYTLVTYRNPLAVVKSQVNRGHVPNEMEAYNNIAAAYRLIYTGLFGKIFFPVNYELLVTYQLDYANAVLERIELPRLSELPEDIRDENRKYA